MGRGRPSDHQTECSTLEYRERSQTRLSYACCEGIHWEEVGALAATYVYKGVRLQNSL